MAQEQVLDTQPRGNDLWVVVGVVACLALGAGATYWLSGGSAPQTPPAPLALKGAVMGVAAPSATPASPVSSAPAAATAPPGTPGIPDEKLTVGDQEYLSLTFDTLSSYYYAIPDPDDPLQKRPKDQIPAPIRALDGKSVAIRGFMVPTTQVDGAVKTFMIVRDRSVCCYGRIPRMNEWVNVSMRDGQTTRLVRDQPITIYGTLHVGEYTEKGVVLSIYRFEADDIAGPLDL